MSNSNFELRALTFLDSLQPQLARLIFSNKVIHQPMIQDAMLIVEVAPAMKIHALVDLVLKHTNVKLGALITERYFGLLFIQHADQGEVITAGQAILRAIGLPENYRTKVAVLTKQIIRSVSSDHLICFNDIAADNKVQVGESVFVMETSPAGYISLICNEALKAATVKLIAIKPFGATSRLIISGREAEVDAVIGAANQTVNNLNEDDNKQWAIDVHTS